MTQPLQPQLQATERMTKIAKRMKNQARAITAHRTTRMRHLRVPLQQLVLPLPAQFLLQAKNTAGLLLGTNKKAMLETVCPSFPFRFVLIFFLGGTVAQDSDPVVALYTGDYDDGNNCGKKVELTNTDNGKTVVATVRDSCPT